MGYVTKTVTESAGDVTKMTSHMFETLEDFLRWDGSQVSDQEEKVDGKVDGKVNGKVGRRYRVIGNELGHEFEVGEEVVVTSIEKDGTIRASNGEEEWWLSEDELEEV